MSRYILDSAKNFCSSPWFHMRVLSSGQLEYCRWMSAAKNPLTSNLNQHNFIKFFQKEMSSVRRQMLKGEVIPGCQRCPQMEEHGKISGRQRQLLKVGIDVDNFAKTFRSSTFYDEFKYSAENNGDTELWPQDWQIDLGNYCNSGCVMCGPASSSKLAAEFKKLGIITQLPPKNWTDDDESIDRFVETLAQSKKISYIHFIGGETLINPAFKKILSKLIDRGLHDSVSIGFTTNLTVWDESINGLLKQYKEINMGVSIECLHPVNDYVRWPSKIDSVRSVLDDWVALANENNWLTQIRITPTIFTIAHLRSIYEYAYINKVGVESCNFLENPAFMRPSVLPTDFRQQIATDLENWVNSKESLDINKKVINTRDPGLVIDSILHDASSYVDYLRNHEDETSSLPALVSYIKKLEGSRGNSILDYSPEYEDFLTSAGY
jgi:sulfatase maturation enzyme AslB (radical SAM superfamily)